jgi:hypothetical protein
MEKVKAKSKGISKRIVVLLILLTISASTYVSTAIIQEVIMSKPVWLTIFFKASPITILQATFELDLETKTWTYIRLNVNNTISDPFAAQAQVLILDVNNNTIATGMLTANLSPGTNVMTIPLNWSPGKTTTDVDEAKISVVKT